jgi:hypothetical protein
MNSIVPDTWKIPPELAARFGDNAGRQRAMNAEGHLLLVLHDPPNPNDQERKAKLLWRAPNGDWACNTDGSVSDIDIVSARPRGVFERNVQSAVRRWKLEPISGPQTVTRTFDFAR